MSIRTMADRALLYLIRDQRHSKFLRQRFKTDYGIEIGLETIGAFDRWRVPRGTTIGRYCSFASTARIIDANHPTGALSTHPAFYLRGWGLVDRDRVVATSTTVEDDVWLGHLSVITPECKTVGRGAIVGAGSVVVRDVPRYAVMTGSPAKLARYRFSPEVIEAVEATRWWEMDVQSLADAARRVPGFLDGPTVETAQAFLGALGRPSFIPRRRPERVARTRGLALSTEEAIGLLRTEISDVEEKLDTPLPALGIDSFSFMNLRLLLERSIGGEISDQTWGAMETVADLVRIVCDDVPKRAKPEMPGPPPAEVLRGASTQTQEATNGSGRFRRYALNMPQMTLEGLSEAWLFKEIGDIHWQNICSGLDTTSASISDDTDARLYATFTRFRIESKIPLVDFKENEDIIIDMSVTRLGAGMFFGDGRLQGMRGNIYANVMTAFSKRGEHGANTSLLKGQPVVPSSCPIVSLPEMPDFALEYRRVRSLALAPPIFECEYKILPPYDINGVGLLYFAAYPQISDLCYSQKSDGNAVFRSSTTKRDVFYFANCSPDEEIVFRLHEWEQTDSTLHMATSLSRKSDGVQMAYILTEKAMNAAHSRLRGPA